MLKKKRRENLVVNKEQITTSKKMQEKVESILSSNHPQFEIENFPFINKKYTISRLYKLKALESCILWLCNKKCIWLWNWI